jgi:hypothetical protein
MDKNTFNAALMATARIACCSGILGLAACDEKQDEDTGTSEATDTADADADTASGDTDTQEEETWEGPEAADPDVTENHTDDDGDGYSELYYDCDDENAEANPGATDPGLDCGYGECQDHIVDVFSEEPTAPSELTLDCCLMVTEVLGFGQLTEYEYRDSCCDLIAENEQFSSACTPWGPPTPPRMPEHLQHAVA